jgi:hypothetical protein
MTMPIPFFGVNTHPNQSNSPPYMRTPDEQVADVVAMGAHLIRADVYGAPSDLELMLPYAQACRARGVELLLCIAHGTPEMNSNEATNYDIGYSWASLVANGMKDFVTYFEITNEMSQCCRPQLGGTEAGQYDSAVFEKCRSFTQGLMQGVRDCAPGAVIVMGGGIVTQTAYDEMMWNGTAPDGSSGYDPVRWDITAWHWYETSGPITAAYDGTSTPYNVLLNLQQYGKPVWLTEIGFNPGDSPDAAAAYVDAALTEYAGYEDVYQVQAVQWYSMYDLAAEGYTFGLMEEDGKTRKPAFTAYLQNMVATR